MSIIAKGRYRLIRTSEIGKEKVEAIVEILNIPHLKPKDITGIVTIEKEPGSKRKKTRKK